MAVEAGDRSAVDAPAQPVALPPSVRVRDLLYAKWRTVRNLPKSQREGGALRILVLIVMGLIVWGMIYAASHWFFAKTLTLEPFGEILVRKLLSMAFLVILAVLFFSNLISAFSTYLLADELQFLMVRPISPYTFFTARYVENTAYSSWMVLLFGMPVFLAGGIVFSAPWDYYVWLIAVLIPFILIPPAIAVMIVMIMANVFPVHRTREVFLGIGAIAFVGVFLVIRSLQPEKFLDPNQFGSTMELFASLQTPGRFWLPSSWAIEVLYPRLRGEVVSIDWLHLGCLYSCAAGGFFLAAWSFRLMHTRGYSRAKEGQHSEVSGRTDSQLRKAREGATEKVSRWAAKQKERVGRYRPMLAIAWKDFIIFGRDTVQWSQLLLLAGLIVVYLVNFRYIGGIGSGGIFGPIGLYFLNIALSGFLVAAVSVRLVFPAVSLEGKAFWLVRRAPLGLRRYLVAKWIGHTPYLLLLAMILTVLSNWMIGTQLWLMFKSIVLIAVLVVSLTGLGVGMGAMFPRFHIDNAAKIATGIGGIMFMLLSIGLTLLVIVLDAWPTYHLLRHELGFVDQMPDAFWLRAGTAWAVALLFCLGSSAIAIVLGSRRLGERYY